MGSLGEVVGKIFIRTVEVMNVGNDAVNVRTQYFHFSLLVLADLDNFIKTGEKTANDLVTVS